MESSLDYKFEALIISPTLKALDIRFVTRQITPSPIIACPAISKVVFNVLFNDRNEWISWPLDQVRHSVTHLQISSEKSYQRITGFNTLQRLRVYGSSYAGYSRNEILIRFICEPTICPLLVELELDFILEWDLLFLMLERRNYLPKSRHISIIKALLLPSPPPSRLLVPLTEILAGRFTVRPSNEDLSMRSFMEAYFDPNM